ncbi:MAG: MoaD/ThiS family protein [Dehalococcoidales bacterium]|jgi:molybdopterin converting factor small subunit
MSVEVEISSIFARYTDDHTSMKMEGKTVGECLRDLARQYPEFGKMILDTNGELTSSFDVFINGESAYPNTMSRPVKDGDKLNIVLLVHGG